MSWSIGLILTVNVLYTGVVINHAMHNRWGLAMAFGGYVLANFGLLLVEKGH